MLEALFPVLSTGFRNNPHGIHALRGVLHLLAPPSPALYQYIYSVAYFAQAGYSPVDEVRRRQSACILTARCFACRCRHSAVTLTPTGLGPLTFALYSRDNLPCQGWHDRR